MRINRCTHFGKRGFQYNDGTCHTGFSARQMAEEDAMKSGNAHVSFDLDGTLIDENSKPTRMVQKLKQFHDEGFKIAVTTARHESAKPVVQKILESIGVAEQVDQIHLTSGTAKGLYFRNTGFSPVLHIDNRIVEIKGLPDSVRGLMFEDKNSGSE